MSFRAHTSAGTQCKRSDAARMTMAIMTVAERETPHWQLQGVSNEADRDGRNRADYSLD